MFLYSKPYIRQSASVIILLTGLYLLLTDSMVSAGGLRCEFRGPEWSQTSPPVDRGHILCGSINSKGRATGYHHREGGVDTTTARIKTIFELNSKTGVYVSKDVSVKGEDGWTTKRTISSFFPDSCTTVQVMRSISYAANNIDCRYPNGKWSGNSAPANDLGEYCRGVDDKPLVLNGYWRTLNEQRVATAWPLIYGKNASSCKTP